MVNLDVSRFQTRAAISDRVNGELSILFRIPTAILWNRLEGRPRSEELGRALRAEVRDPLWMLARQWQFGEFKGEDAGIPVRAELLAETTTLASLAARDQPPKVYSARQPLEFVVERQKVEPDLMMGFYIGRVWLRVLALELKAAAGALIDGFKTSQAYGIHKPARDPGDARASTVWVAPSNQTGEQSSTTLPKDLESLKSITHRGECDVRLAMAGRGIDGARLVADIAKALTAGTSPSDQFAAQGVAIPGVLKAKVDSLAGEFKREWFDKLFPPPSGDEDAWIPEHLEHDFSLGVSNGDGTETKLIADQYPGGHLDWYSFDVVGRERSGVANPPAAGKRVKSFVPMPLRFPGMPNLRWWEFEDNRVGFGLTTASKTDFVKLLLAEFGLVFSNDWFILPFGVDIGTLTDTRGIVVTDNFGCNTLIEPTAKRHAEAGFAGNWGLWNLSKRDAPGTVDTRFFLAPALSRALESKPIEEVAFLRDEMANLVWALETVIPDPLGGGRDGRAAGKLLRAAIAQAYPEDTSTAPLPGVPLSYQLMGGVPENWIPLVAVKLQGQSVSTAFLQGAMPRVPPLGPVRDAANQPILEHNVVLPRSTILARNPVENPNLIHEEEVLRSGGLVQRTFQQARWHGGETFTWVGRKKQNGKGEGESGLAFDQVLQVKPPTTKP